MNQTDDTVIQIAKAYNNQRFDDAISQSNTLIANAPKVPADVWAIRGLSLLALDQIEEAVPCFEAALSEDSQNGFALFGRGVTASRQRRFKDAVGDLTAASEAMPKMAEIHFHLGQAYYAIQRFARAARAFEAALEISPDRADAHNGLGNALREQGRTEEAIASYKRHVAVDPGSAGGFNNLGIAYSNQGQAQLALESFEQAVALDPDYAEAWRNLSVVKTFGSSDPELEILETKLDAATLPETAQMHLNFALAKAYDDVGAYERAFTCFSQGNALRKRQFPYDGNDDELLFSRIRDSFSAPNAPSPLSAEPLATTPVFIVGLPRAGTTVVEQLLSNHPDVFGAGELMLLAQALGPQLGDLRAEGPFRIGPAGLAEVRHAYLSGLSSLSPSPVKYITDKMPLNFRWIGFILAALPEAKIIHVQRNAVANGWSLYRHFFSTTGNRFAYDLDDIARFIELSRSLMAFWTERFGTQMLTVQHEDFIAAPDRTAREMAGFLNLDWKDSYLEIATNRRSVLTASQTQVRAPVRGRGQREEWHNYEAHLGPLINLDKSERP